MNKFIYRKGDLREVPSWLEKAIGASEDEAKALKRSGSVLKTPKGDLDMGTLSIPTLRVLRKSCPKVKGKLTVNKISADVAEVHKRPEADGALFQVASQFNLLEMPASNVTPESGITGYEFDKTQGPACAMATPGGLLYRQYLYQFSDGEGQTASRQIDCAKTLHDCIRGAIGHSPWDMKNGYLIPRIAALPSLEKLLTTAPEDQLSGYRDCLRVGFHRGMQVANSGNRVSHVYASAVPFDGDARALPLVQLILEAAYEATFASACINAAQTGNRRVYLTLIGGGVFMNPKPLIEAAIERAARLYEKHDLIATLIHYNEGGP